LLGLQSCNALQQQTEKKIFCRHIPPDLMNLVL
jgi:hypothetical protein